MTDDEMKIVAEASQQQLSVIRAKLNEKIPRDVIAQRKAGNGKNLDYLEGWYVISRMNEIFGQGNWNYDYEDLTRVYETQVTSASGKSGRAVAYTAKVTLTAEMADKVVAFSDVGAGKGIDYGMGLEADESATKEAITDGVKRCAKNLGNSMGLALYDKTQENVEEEAPKAVKAATPPKAVAKIVTSSGGVTPDTLAMVASTFRVAEAKKVKTREELKGVYAAKYNVTSTADLTEEQAGEFLAYLNQLIKEN